MSSNHISKEELVDSIDADEISSVDDFIRELEEKEKDLHISSDLVIEVGESSVEHDNIHDSFLSSFEFYESSSEDGESEAPEDRVNTQEAKAEEDDGLLQQIDELIAERDDLMDALRRQKIDFENYRNRTDRDRSSTFRSILSGMALQILPVLDNLERALDSVSDSEDLGREEVSRFVEGIVLVNHQMNEVLIEMGIEPISAVGDPFDPRLHEAVDCVPSDSHPHNTVVEELVRGYMIGDRVIRPSMVMVSESTKKRADLYEVSEEPEE